MGKIKIKCPWIIIPLETKARELDAKILFSCFAAEAGFGVVLSHYGILADLIDVLPRGIFFEKNISPWRLEVIKNRRKLGYVYVCLDEEGLICDHTFCKDRLSEETLYQNAYYFTWGIDHANCIFKAFPDANNKVVITGSPRVDLLRSEFREYFSEKYDTLRRKYGKYILINSNFGGSNFLSGSNSYFNLQKKFYIKNAEEERQFKQRLMYKKRLFKSFLELIIPLSKSFPDYKIIIRPHPEENHETWENASADYRNVEVIFDGSATPWILGAEVVIHNGCTTGLEAFLLGVPVVSYRPYVSEQFDEYLPNIVSRQVFNKDSLLELLNKIFRKKTFKDNTYEFNEIIKNHIANFEGPFSSESIINIMKKMNIEPQNLVLPLKVPLKKVTKDIKEKSINFTKGLIKKGLLIEPNLTGLFVGRDRVLRWQQPAKSLVHQKFPGATFDEIQISINKFSSISGRFKNVKTFQINNNCFCITNDKKIINE